MPVVNFTDPSGDQRAINVRDDATDDEVRVQIQASIAARGRFLGQLETGREVGLPMAQMGLAVGAGFLAPAGLAAVGLQATIAGAFSLARELTSPEPNLMQAGQEALVAGGTQGLFNAGARALSGLGAIRRARAGGEPVPFPRENRGGVGQDFARATSGSFGLSGARRANERLVNRAVAKGMGLSDDVADDVARAGFDESILRQARSGINEIYAEAGPRSPVAIGRVREILTDLKEQGLPDSGIKQVLARFGASPDISPGQWQGIQRTLRDVRARTARNPTFSGLGDDIDEAIDLLDEAAVASGGNKKLLSEANQRFKLLATAEESNALIATGDAPAGQIIRLMSRNSFKGFGRRTIAEGRTERLLPEIQDVIRIAKKANELERVLAPGSETFGRMARLGTGGALAASLAGTGISGTSLFLGGLLGAVELGGLAAIGRTPTGVLPSILGPLASQRPSVFNQPEGQ